MRTEVPFIATAVPALKITGAPQARANTGFENRTSPGACARSQATSRFKYAVPCDSVRGGAWRNAGHSVGDFADERTGGTPRGGTRSLKSRHAGRGPVGVRAGSGTTPPP